MFKIDPASFNMTNLVVAPITCSPSDSQWSLQVPPVVAADQQPVTIQLRDTTQPANAFVLGEGAVRLSASFLLDLAQGSKCPFNGEIQLEFVLSSASADENIQTVKVPL